MSLLHIVASCVVATVAAVAAVAVTVVIIFASVAATAAGFISAELPLLLLVL